MTQRDDLVSRLRNSAYFIERWSDTSSPERHKAIESEAIELLPHVRSAATALEAKDAEIARAMDMLGDVPGATLTERVERVVSYHLGLQCLLEESKTRIAELERQLAGKEK